MIYIFYTFKLDSISSKDTMDETNRLENHNDDCPLDVEELGLLHQKDFLSTIKNVD